ncbi:MAG: nitrogenase component 1 [Bacteroidales bacterium]|nr:nitrogenase component 1 [Bacteroidales bacterium]
MEEIDIQLIKEKNDKSFASTRNACKLCTPLGACIAFKGIEGCVPLIHGSQGCATYIRRYMISHYREPVDIASSNFSEESTIFGGNKNFCLGIDNIIAQYNPKVVAIASTCLSETIGEDVPQLIREYQLKNTDKELPRFIYASTPSYQGTHIDGFHEAVAATVKAISEQSTQNQKINFFPGFLSTEDLRYLKEILSDFELEYNILADYSDSLDNPSWEKYMRIPDGGTSIENIVDMGNAAASIEFGYILNKGRLAGKNKKQTKAYTAAQYLEEKFSIPRFSIGMPIGIKETDKFFKVLSRLSGNPMPEKHDKERGRLIDSYADGHKQIFGKKAVVYGEEDFVLGMVSFLNEIGIDVIIAASGAYSGKLKGAIDMVKTQTNEIHIMDDSDFENIREMAEELHPDIIIGHSKGYYISRQLGIPLLRVGFPIHDRMGGQRIMHVGYKGTQQLFDKIVNAIVEQKQNNSPVGYKYI